MKEVLGASFCLALHHFSMGYDYSIKFISQGEDMMKYASLAILMSLLFGCATPIPKTPATTYDHKDKKARSAFDNLTPQEVEALVGPSLIKGYDAIMNEGEEKTIYRLVYVQVDQDPVMNEDLRMTMKNGTDTNVKCMSFNFSKSYEYKFKSSTAPMSWDFDCSYYKDIKDE